VLYLAKRVNMKMCIRRSLICFEILEHPCIFISTHRFTQRLQFIVEMDSTSQEKNARIRHLFSGCRKHALYQMLFIRPVSGKLPWCCASLHIQVHQHCRWRKFGHEFARQRRMRPNTLTTNSMATTSHKA